MRKRFALVFNARAGIARPRLLDGVLGVLKSAGAEVFQLAARSADEATLRVRELAVAGEADAVIAAGGDGTFRAVAAGAAETALPVGFIPLGTGNVLAYEIGLRKRAEVLGRYLLDGDVLPVKGGYVNGAPFFLMVGAGFDAEIVRRLNYRTKRVIGRAAYVAPVYKTLSAPVQRFDVSVDGARHQASWVIVTRASRYGGSFVLTRDTQLGADPMLAIIVEAETRGALVGAALSLALGRLGRVAASADGVKVISAKRVQIGVRTAVPLQVDGDDAGTTPADVSADGSVVNLIVPGGYVADLTNRHTNHLDLLV